MITFDYSVCQDGQKLASTASSFFFFSHSLSTPYAPNTLIGKFWKSRLLDIKLCFQRILWL